MYGDISIAMLLCVIGANESRDILVANTSADRLFFMKSTVNVRQTYSIVINNHSQSIYQKISNRIMQFLENAVLAKSHLFSWPHENKCHFAKTAFSFSKCDFGETVSFLRIVCFRVDPLRTNVCASTKLTHAFHNQSTRKNTILEKNTVSPKSHFENPNAVQDYSIS